MQTSKLAHIALLALVAFGASSVVATPITIQASHHADRGAGNGFHTTTTISPTSIPTSVLNTGSLFGNSQTQSQTQVDFTGSSNQTTLLYTTNQQRLNPNGDLYYYGASYGSMTFLANQNTTYDISGLFSANDLGAASRSFFEVHLYDTALGSYGGSMFYAYQDSRFVPDSILALGVSGGDSGFGVSGSLSGSLVAGRSYSFSYTMLNQTWNPGDLTGTASGFLRLDIGGSGSSSSVPESGTTLILLGLTFSSLALLRRKFSRA